MEVDPLLGEAHSVLAQTLELYDWNWAEAEQQYKRALELSPNYALAHVKYGRFLQALGRNDEAMKQMTYAAELNPIDLETLENVAWLIWAARQYDSALSRFNELNVSYPRMCDFCLGWSYRAKIMYPEAIAALSLPRLGRFAFRAALSGYGAPYELPAVNHSLEPHPSHARWLLPFVFWTRLESDFRALRARTIASLPAPCGLLRHTPYKQYAGGCTLAHSEGFRPQERLPCAPATLDQGV